MARATDLASLPIDQFYRELGDRLDQSSELITRALILADAAAKRIDELEQRIVVLERSGSAGLGSA